MGNRRAQNVVYLPRGGVLLASSQGPIQYGAVPETIKDTMATETGVPLTFVVPPRLLSPERAVNLAELEFPAYWNFFLKGKRTTIVCRPAHRDGLRRILSEAVFGPRAVDTKEFGSPQACAPDLTAEMAYFRRSPKTGRQMELDDLVEFVEFGADGKARLAGGVDLAIEDSGGLTVVEGGVARSIWDGEPPLPPPASRVVGTGKSFRRPVLGVSVVGSGHGFDPGNRTSGFIMWIDGRGVMVDPPVDAVDWLAGYDVDPRQIDSLILTHCHADHDAGTLQMLLQEGRITIYTTPTVLSSFVTKYSNLTGLEPAAFRRLFDHVPVCTTQPLSIHGAQVRFRYSLHSIPCVGFEVGLRGRSLVYPSDTLNDPSAIRKLRDEGVVSQVRARQLADFPWHHQLILHEAGIPPIHTPVSYLAGLDEAVKSRMRLVHVSSKSLPENSGLTVAPTGLENTIDLEAPRLPVEGAVEVLDALARVDMLDELPVTRAVEFLRTVRKQTFAAGERVLACGEPGDAFYIILSGHAAVSKGGREFKVYSDFDYFGETALLTGKPRVADVFAKTELTVLSLDRADFLHLIRGTDLAGRMVHLAELRELPTWELLTSSPVFAGLSANQKTQLQALMEPADFAAGTVLGPDPVLVASGVVSVRVKEGRQLSDITRGGFAGDARRLRGSRPSSCEFTCRTAVKGYVLVTRAFKSFLKKNPGVYLRLANLETGQRAG